MAGDIVPIELGLTDGNSFTLWAPRWRDGDDEWEAFLGLDEDEAALWLVEWPERGAGALPPLDLHVALEMQGDGRKACLQAHSPAGRAWLAQVEQAGHLRGLPAI